MSAHGCHWSSHVLTVGLVELTCHQVVTGSPLRGCGPPFVFQVQARFCLWLVHARGLCADVVGSAGIPVGSGRQPSPHSELTCCLPGSGFSASWPCRGYGQELGWGRGGRRPQPEAPTASGRGWRPVCPPHWERVTAFCSGYVVLGDLWPRRLVSAVPSVCRVALLVCLKTSLSGEKRVSECVHACGQSDKEAWADPSKRRA